MRNIKLQSMHLEYAFPLASWSYKCHGNFITIQVCMHTYICTAIWGTIFVLHGDYLHLTSLGPWTHISISECTLKYCKSASLREKKGDFFWLSKSSFSFLSQFCIFFFSFLSNPLLSIIMWCSSHTEERKQTCYAICHHWKHSTATFFTFNNRVCHMKCNWGSPVILQHYCLQFSTWEIQMDISSN